MAKHKVVRRLAAILATDVVGYSRLMGEDEAETLTALKAHQAQFIDPTISEYQGRIVKLMGDGALVEFASVIAAVECAIAIQDGMAKRNAKVPEGRRMEFRIGVNLGDVIIDGEDIHGDGVNVAARLEGLAKPGGVCISGTVHEHVVGKLDLTFDDMGEKLVKNIARPVRVYLVRREGSKATTAVASAAKVELELPDKPSIAVLAFDNMSNDPEQEYFADGIAEDIITTLSKISELLVIARNSTFAYKGRSPDVRQVAQELGVRYVLEGSVRKAASRVRITAQLIDATTGHHVWADRFDRGLEDVFAVQEEITQEIVTALEVNLTRGEDVRLWRKRSGTPKAYEHYLRGLDHYHRVTRATNAQARQEFERAIEISPDFAAAYHYLGWVHGTDGLFGWSESAKESLEKALELADKAITLDDTLADAYAVRACVLMVQRDGENAVAEAKRAVALNPNGAEVHHVLAMMLIYQGDPEAAIAA
ncbi:MAG: adenylate/guanylate cyclase domain-containing protein, partial [Alphaproteobacteria bacterium]|nr:adenylate/guanylate cyclase domain-containing protein [Alphaproteobacteria bacterium]